MSIRSCEEFLRAAYDSEDVTRQLKVVTEPQELVRLGQRHGYAFNTEELIEASSCFQPAPRDAHAASPVQAPTSTAFYHREYDMADLPGFEAVLEELPRLKARPSTLDLGEFNRSFREDDMETTSMSPAAPEFQVWHNRMMEAHWHDPKHGLKQARRDFHLVNVDHHTSQRKYDEYFDAKVRTLCALERLFGQEVQFSASLWYPPNSYRLWHTNETQPGWRMYVVDFEDEAADPERTSFFRYMNPDTGDIVTLNERTRVVRFFKVEQDPRKLFWHCIVNPTRRHRWSFGFVVPENWLDAISGAPVALTN